MPEQRRANDGEDRARDGCNFADVDKFMVADAGPVALNKS